MKKVLIVSNPSDDEHTDLVIQALQNKKVEVVRWHPENILLDSEITVTPDGYKVFIKSSGREFESSKVRSVWMRRPKPIKTHSNCSEQANSVARIETKTIIKAILRDNHTLWFSHPSSINESENKLLQLKKAKEVDLNVPNWLASNSVHELLIFIDNYNDNVIIKPISSQTVRTCLLKNNQSLTTSIITTEDIERLDGNELNNPIFIQRRIDRDIEVRTTVIGRTIQSAAIHTYIAFDDPKVDGRWGQAYAPHSEIPTPEKVKEGILKFQEYFGLNYGAFDFLIDKQGDWWFLECNPVGQFAWLDKKLKSFNLVETMASCLAGELPALVH